jgi:radical SAM superfamily enzyme
MEKNVGLLGTFDGDYAVFIELGVQQLANKAGNHFRRCHIVVN